MKLDRRTLMQSLTVAGALGCAPCPLAFAAPFVPPAGPRARVLYLNDLAGDIDGLFATVHIILSTSIDLRGIVGTDGPSAEAKALADEILKLMGKSGQVATFAGTTKMSRPGIPAKSPGAQAIIDEAMRTDTSLPLFVAVGGGLTEVASALLIEPKIADKFTLVWIGGGKAHPEGAPFEPNFGIDPLAAQHVFNETTVPIWQIPSEVYQTCVVSSAELNAYVAPHGEIGRWLYAKVVAQAEKYKAVFNPGATWTLGDNPLVVVTALNDWVPSGAVSPRGPFKYLRTGSSHFTEIAAPRLDAKGMAIARSAGRQIRVYRDIDNRLMLGDFFARLRESYPELR